MHARTAMQLSSKCEFYQNQHALKRIQKNEPNHRRRLVARGIKRGEGRCKVSEANSHGGQDDGEPGGTSGLFDSFPFLTAIDQPLQSEAGKSIRLVYNGSELILPRDPADKGGLVAVFR